MVIVWRLGGNIIRIVLYIANVVPLQWAQLTKTVHTAQLGLESFLWFYRLHDYLYVGVCFVLSWSVESFPFMLWRWRNKLKWAPFELFAPSSSLRVRSWLHPSYGHCEQQAMLDEGVIYVAGHPLLNRRRTRLPGCYCFPKCKLQHLKARYSLIVLKVQLNSSQSIYRLLRAMCSYSGLVCRYLTALIRIPTILSVPELSTRRRFRLDACCVWSRTSPLRSALCYIY